ncbi:MAG: hypothetical protein HYT73_01680 [Candidatus Aenigmarchaeota archaeon]|nr:hypothetical protein [Candidatus Aenigmarchaeota archaeon]
MEKRKDEWRKKGAAMIIIGIISLFGAFLIFAFYEMPEGGFAKSLFFLIAGMFLIVAGKRSYHFG